MVGVVIAVIAGPAVGSAHAATDPVARPAPGVAVSIAPIHSLVAQVMDGVGQPHLIVDAAASPHTHALAPSDARALSTAALIVWVGPELETFLVKPIATLAPGPALGNRVLTLADLPDLVRLPYRGRHDHDHDQGEDQAQGHDPDHDGETEAHDTKAHDTKAHDTGPGLDPHLWLDPANARVIVAAVAQALVEVDPARAETYRANAARAEAGLADLEARLDARLTPVREMPFAVFHDAYQYLEHRFGLRRPEVVTLAPDTPAGAGRMAAIRADLSRGAARCLFAEPQFAPDRVQALAEGTPARTAILDPLGAAHPPGPALYGALMEDLATAMAGCLADPS